MSARTSRSSGSAGAFPNIDFLDSLKPTRMKLGLENISRLLGLFSNPQDRFPAVLIAGTNGKGSVTAFLSSILTASGLRVGAFYSPHLFRINERIKIDGEEIPSPDLDAILAELKERYDEVTFTYFEGITAAAALYFERSSVDIAVFEVGLGGRLDATRLVNAVLTVITGISIDHHEHLGTTRSAILSEKLGIARKDVPLVANLSTGRLLEKARRHVEGLPARFHSVRDEVEIGGTRFDAKSLLLDLETPVRRYRNLETRMIGAPQAWNVATAVRAGELLVRYSGGALGRRKKSAVPRNISAKSVREGLGRAFLPGRFQALSGDPRIILDVSHNEESLTASLRTLRSLSPREKNIVLFAIQAHKELGKFPSMACRSAREIILAPLDTERGASVGILSTSFPARSELGGGAITKVGSIAAGIREAKERLRGGDSLLICGSHLTVEEAVGHL